MKRTDLFVLIFFALFSIILAGWILVNPHNVGTGDWDQHFLYYGAPRITILEYRQFPLWNPYYCGGSPLLANAQSVFLNPFFLFILLFGEVLGIKIIILLHVFIGLLGMWLLAFHLGARKLSAVLAAVLFTGSSWLPLHLYEGHSIFIAMAYVPFAVLFYLKSYSSLRNVIFSAFFLALMSFSGSTPYALFFTIVLLSCHFLLRLLKNRRVSESRVIVMVFALAFLFSAVKVLPLLEFNHYSGFEATNEQPITIRIIIDSLISRNQYGLHRSTVFISENLKLPFGWHEYGAYIGIIPLALFLLSFVFLFRKYPEWIALSIIFLVLAFGNELFLWPLLHSLPLFKSLHVPSRFIILFVFCCSLLSSLLLSR
ncbi:hypothetical protein JXA85_00675, partial [Candidatus Woesearchaeota archaeon]|nr:hypothetical protein [Candidatus Woesearchaeota archaeon]